MGIDITYVIQQPRTFLVDPKKSPNTEYVIQPGWRLPLRPSIPSPATSQLSLTTLLANFAIDIEESRSLQYWHPEALRKTFHLDCWGMFKLTP